MRAPSLLVSALALAATAPAFAQAPDFAKVEITSEVLAPGVAVLFGYGGNIGVSHGPDGTVLVDDQFAPLTDKIQAAIKQMGAPPVRFVINTHWHFDHAGGNENFGKAGIPIFAQDNVRTRLIAGGGTLGNVIPPAPPAALPVVTFDKGITIHLNGDTIDAIHTGGGHTDGDSVLFWRKANVLHTGDMFLNGMPFPFIDTASGGNAVRLVATLDRLLVLTNAETKIIPGHGSVTNRTQLKVWRDRIAGAVTHVQAAQRRKQTLESFLAANPFKPLDQPGAFVNSDGFARAVWESTAAKPKGPAHRH
jgi:cyclase